LSFEDGGENYLLHSSKRVPVLEFILIDAAINNKVVKKKMIICLCKINFIIKKPFFFIFPIFKKLEK